MPFLISHKASSHENCFGRTFLRTIGDMVDRQADNPTAQHHHFWIARLPGKTLVITGPELQYQIFMNLRLFAGREHCKQFRSWTMPWREYPTSKKNCVHLGIHLGIFKPLCFGWKIGFRIHQTGFCLGESFCDLGIPTLEHPWTPHTLEHTQVITVIQDKMTWVPGSVVRYLSAIWADCFTDCFLPGYQLRKACCQVTSDFASRINAVRTISCISIDWLKRKSTGNRSFDLTNI